jgi:hypothetical protein
MSSGLDELLKKKKNLIDTISRQDTMSDRIPIRQELRKVNTEIQKWENIAKFQNIFSKDPLDNKDDE